MAAVSVNKIEDEDTDEILYTRISCVLLDTQSCQCSDYRNRFQKVPDGIQRKPDLVDEFHWLPVTCAYRLLSEGKELPDWHPLRSGTAETVHEAGASVRGWAVSEKWVDEDDWYAYLIDEVEF